MATPHSTFGTKKVRPFPVDEVPAQDRTLSHGAPAKKLFGVLPIMRLIPQDIHSVMDYANAGGFATGAVLTDCPKARAASIILGSAGAGVSLMTDYRLSVAKVIPIEAHEVIDHAWGLMAIASPFVLGYWKSAPRVALSHVIAGASTILASLFTDYRAFSKRPR
jgi:hypothetical protein